MLYYPKIRIFTVQGGCVLPVQDRGAQKGIGIFMAQNDIGIDLGTTTIIIAQQGTGVVLNQPSVVAVDTRKNTVLEVGDKALAMVGVPPTISRRPSP